MEFTEQVAVSKNPVDLKRELGRYLRYWPLFAASTALALLGAWLYLRYATPQYMTRASLYVQSSNGKKGDFTALQDFQSMALPTGLGSNEVDNELSVIKSKPLLLGVVKALQLEVTAIKEGKIRISELYAEAPVKGTVLKLRDPRRFTSASFKITDLKGSGYRLRTETREYTARYGEPLHLYFGTVVLTRQPNIRFDGELLLRISNPRLVADELDASISVVIPQKKSSIMELSRTGINPERSEAVLNELMRQYNADAIRDKNAEAVATAQFIDERLDLITRELGGIESQKENFKEANNIADLQTQAELSLQNASENTKKLMELGTQLNMVNSVLGMAGSASNEQLLPTNVGMPSGLDQVIAEYNQLVLTRNRTLRQATGANPAVQQFNRDIASMRQLIRDNLVKAKANLQVAMGGVQQEINKSGAAISRFPGQERVFRNIERQQNLKEALFLYLLQKREETSIAMAVTAPKAKVVNPAYTSFGPVAPKRNMIYLGAFLLGLLLPAGFLYGRFALDTYVHSRRDLRQQLPEVPLLGEIPALGKNDSDLIELNDLSAFAESFRIMLNNLKFLLTHKEAGRAPVLLVTSSVKGEGKTTVSMNTAVALSQTKRVLLIGADIRNPQLRRFLKVTSHGLSDFLAGDTDSYKEYIEPSGISPNLEVIQSGTMAPNPGDLLESDRFRALLEAARGVYDYVVIDSAPLMLVGDTTPLLPYADALLYVVRAGVTEKEMLEFAGQVYQTKAQGHMGLVLNAVEATNLGYGNKYGYGYGTEKTRKSWKDYFKF